MQGLIPVSPQNLLIAVLLGNIPLIVAFVVYALRVDRLLTKFFVEHEMLIGWYCKENGIRLDELPTRARGKF